jgi:hypothetical protein
MRYEQQVVLQMQPGSAPGTGSAPKAVDAAPAAVPAKPVAVKTAAPAKIKMKRPMAKLKGKPAVRAHRKANAMGAPVEGAR